MEMNKLNEQIIQSQENYEYLKFPEFLWFILNVSPKS